MESLTHIKFFLTHPALTAKFLGPFSSLWTFLSLPVDYIWLGLVGVIEERTLLLVFYGITMCPVTLRMHMYHVEYLNPIWHCYK